MNFVLIFMGVNNFLNADLRAIVKKYPDCAASAQTSGKGF
jgi:hypothetical protein